MNTTNKSLVSLSVISLAAVFYLYGQVGDQKKQNASLHSTLDEKNFHITQLQTKLENLEKALLKRQRSIEPTLGDDLYSSITKGEAYGTPSSKELTKDLKSDLAELGTPKKKALDPETRKIFESYLSEVYDEFLSEHDEETKKQVMDYVVDTQQLQVELNTMLFDKNVTDKQILDKQEELHLAQQKKLEKIFPKETDREQFDHYEEALPLKQARQMIDESFSGAKLSSEGQKFLTDRYLEIKRNDITSPINFNNTPGRPLQMVTEQNVKAFREMGTNPQPQMDAHKKQINQLKKEAKNSLSPEDYLKAEKVLNSQL